MGDNWDNNILPSYRTSDSGTLSLYLFTCNITAVQDRVPPIPKLQRTEENNMTQASEFFHAVFDQKQLMKELKFIFIISIFEQNLQLQSVYDFIYPKHLNHPYSHFSGHKTFQVNIYSNCKIIFSIFILTLIERITKLIDSVSVWISMQ